MNHERRILTLALLAGLPGSGVALFLLWGGDYTLRLKITLTSLILIAWVAFAVAARSRVVFSFQTLSNLVSALREEDYSIRGHASNKKGVLGEVMRELNALGDALREQRLGALEATALLRKVMEEIDVAMLTFDAEQRLRLLNRAGERLLGQPSERLLGRAAAELGLQDCLEGENPRTIQKSFPGGAGRWEARRSIFREKGVPHELLVLADLSRALREEERQAWQRLIRVLGHELNNSLAPIKSIAHSLETLLAKPAPPPDWKDDTLRGLGVIGARAESLDRFMSAYAQLAQLPPPRFREIRVGEWIRRVVQLETRLQVALEAGPELTLRADGDQLDQLLINLVRNAVDACLETGGGVKVAWKKDGGYLEVSVEDEGPGLPNTTNLFVPFFTTKSGGSGIGLVLSRQIAEAHGGSLTLENRQLGPGCKACLRLPIQHQPA